MSTYDQGWDAGFEKAQLEVKILQAEKMHYVALLAQKDRVIERLQHELANRNYGTEQIMRDEIEKERAAIGATEGIGNE